MGFLDQIKDTIQNFQSNFKIFDPSSLNDEIAMKTDWNSAKSGGSRRQTHEIVSETPNRLEIKVKSTTLIFPVIFSLMGLSAIFSGFIFRQMFDDITVLLFTMPMGFVFFAIGVGIFINSKIPQTFDKANGYYWKGKKNPNEINNPKKKCRLIDIHALQIIQEYVRNNSSNSNTGSASYNSYEINLVLKDGQRINVIDHGEKPIVLKEAEKLSQFLNVQIWNALMY